MNIKIRYIPYFMICVGIFVFPYILRDAILLSIANINFLVYSGLLIAWSQTQIGFDNNKIRKFLVVTFILVASSLLFYVTGNGWSYFRKIKLLFVYVFPIIFLNIKVYKKGTIEFFIVCWYKFIKYICYIMVFFGVLDKVLGNTIQGLWVLLYKSSTLEGMVRAGRLVSFYGHPLTNACLFLTLLCWTIILKEIKILKRSYIGNIAVCLVGLGMTGSKSGMVLALVVLLVCHVGLKNIKYMVALITVIVVIYVTGGFDMVFERLMEGIRVGDITTSRNSALIRLMENGILKFNLIQGHIIDYSGTSMIAALEYPFLRWAYTNGIIFSMVMYLGYFIIPLVRIIEAKNLRILFCVLVLMMYANGNNGISAYNDDLLFYSINLGLIILSLKKNIKALPDKVSGGKI